MKSGLGWERTIKLDLFSKNSLFSEFLIYETSLTINFSCSKEIINQSYVNLESLILRRIIPPIVVFPTHRPLRFPFEKAARETRATLITNGPMKSGRPGRIYQTFFLFHHCVSSLTLSSPCSNSSNGS